MSANYFQALKPGNKSRQDEVDQTRRGAGAGRLSSRGAQGRFVSSSCKRGLHSAPRPRARPPPLCQSIGHQGVRHPGSMAGTLPGKLLGTDFWSRGGPWWPEHRHVIRATTCLTSPGCFSTTWQEADADGLSGSPHSLWDLGQVLPCSGPQCF